MSQLLLFDCPPVARPNLAGPLLANNWLEADLRVVVAVDRRRPRRGRRRAAKQDTMRTKNYAAAWVLARYLNERARLEQLISV